MTYLSVSTVTCSPMTPKSKSIFTTNDCSQLQMDLTSLEAWCDTWKLRLNQNKSTHLRLSFSNRTNSPHNCHYNIAGAQLQLVRSQRDLGVVISNTLSWQQHYTKLCLKAYNALHLIKRTLSASASVNLKTQLYISLVRSHLSAPRCGNPGM